MQSAIWPSSPSQSIFSLLCPSSPSLPFGPFAGCMFIPRHQIFPQPRSRKTNYFSSICSTFPPTRSVRTLSIAAATAASTRASCSPLSVPTVRVCAAWATRLAAAPRLAVSPKFSLELSKHYLCLQCFFQDFELSLNGNSTEILQILLNVC